MYVLETANINIAPKTTKGDAERQHIDELMFVRVCRICQAIVYVVVFASAALSVFTGGYATEHKRE